MIATPGVQTFVQFEFRSQADLLVEHIVSLAYLDHH